MNHLPSLTAAMVLLAPLTMAQERTAGSPIGTQMTWSALSNQIGVVKDQVNLVDSKVTTLGNRLDTIDTRVNTLDGKVTQLVSTVMVLDDRVSKLETCGKRGRVYAPGVTGTDAQGCLAVSGRDNCPAGFTLIGEKGTAEAFCISSNAEPSRYWADAVAGCYGKSPKAHLCTTAEWSTACAAGVHNMKIPDFEWVSGVVGNKYGAALIGGNTCSSVMSNASYPFQANSRCCFR